MARNLAGYRLNARTPISVEREFSLFSQDTRPTRRGTTERFMHGLRSRLARGRYEVVEEVAGNSFELKVCFSTPADIREDMRRAYRGIIAEAQMHGLLVSGISSPVHAQEFNDFFTTMAFPRGKRFIGRTNSIHIHVSGASEDELVRRYAIGNILAPVLLDISQSSVIDGQERGRANQLRSFLCSVPNEMANPAQVDSFQAFYMTLESARRAAQESIRRTLNGQSRSLCSNFPGFARLNGHGLELLQLTPDKLFSLARLRPDKRSDELGLAGSVELRSLDGQATLERDLALIELTIGALAYMESRQGCGILSVGDIHGIRRHLESAAGRALHTDNGGRALAEQTARDAQTGLTEMDMQPEYLDLVLEMISRPAYLDYSGMGDERIIRRSAQQFIPGVG